VFTIGTPNATAPAAQRPNSRPRTRDDNIDLAMLALVNAPIEDPVVFQWVEQKLEGDEDAIESFRAMYVNRKKQKATAHILNILAFFCLGGLHRIYLGDYVLGLAHFFTFGFCWIGTVLDFILINRRVNLANVAIANEVLMLVRATRRRR